MRGGQYFGEVGVGVLGWARREEEGGSGVKESDAFGVGAVAGHKVAESWRPAGEAYDFGGLDAFGIADAEDLGAEYEAGNLDKDLGGEREEGGEERGRGVAGFWVAVSGLQREIQDGEAGMYLGEDAIEMSRRCRGALAIPVMKPLSEVEESL